jgi:hypothetical protein
MGLSEKEKLVQRPRPNSVLLDNLGNVIEPEFTLILRLAGESRHDILFGRLQELVYRRVVIFAQLSGQTSSRCTRI